MSKWAREMLKGKAIAESGQAPVRKPGPVAGESKPKPVHPEVMLQRDILGRALVFKIYNEIGHDEAKKIICGAYITLCGERWNRIVRRRIYSEVGPDLMSKIVTTVGIKPFRVWSQYQMAADELCLELNSKNIDVIDRHVTRQKLAALSSSSPQQHLEGAHA